MLKSSWTQYGITTTKKGEKYEKTNTNPADNAGNFTSGEHPASFGKSVGLVLAHAKE
jgi:hypothetical protein